LKESPYINGFDKPTIADISAYCEIKQLLFLNYSFEKYPTLTKWMGRMEQIPEVIEGHKTFHKLVNSFLKK
jgi:glutathione S-transferase